VRRCCLFKKKRFSNWGLWLIREYIHWGPICSPKQLLKVRSDYKSQLLPKDIYLKPNTINTRLPVYNPIIWQFEKVNVPPKLFSLHYFGNLLVFPVIHIIPLFYSWKIRPIGQKMIFFKILKIFWPRRLIFQSIMKLFGCRTVEWCG
jgi:hypothetical protein